MKNDLQIEEMLGQLDNLYEKDPDQFERIRSRIIDTTINSFPEQHRKRAAGIQFTLERELDKHKNPVMRMNHMVEIFWEQVAEFNAVVHDPLGVMNDREKKKPKKPAKVVQLF